MSRSLWKVDLKSIYKEKFKDGFINHKRGTLLKILSRNSLIADSLIDTKISVYNGKSFINIFVNNLKVGYKFGQFVYTRKKFLYKKVKKVKKK